LAGKLIESILEASIKEKEEAGGHIYDSDRWKVLLVYYRLRDKILPRGSSRRRAAKFVWNIFKNKVFKNLDRHKLN